MHKNRLNLKKFLQNETIRIIILLMFSLALLISIQIFLHDMFFAPDAIDYAKMVEVFRGKAKLKDVNPPFRSRILVPFIASLIPGDPFFSLSVVNIIFTLLSVILFNRFLLYFEFSEKKRILGTLLYIIAVPTMIIGGLPISDSAQLFFIILTLYLYSTLENNLKKDLVISIVISIGILARETVILIAPIIILWILIDSEVHWKQLFHYFVFIGLNPLIWFILINVLFFQAYANSFFHTYDSILSRVYLKNNYFQLSLFATIIQISLLLIIGIFSNFSNLIKREKIIWKLIIGMIIYSLLIVWSFINNVMAARYCWPIYVFIIPFFLYSFNDSNNFKEDYIV